MAVQFSLSWNAVAGVEGYNVHSGSEDGVWTDMQDVGNTTGPVVVTVTTWSGDGFACVAGYVTIEEVLHEGPYSASVPVTASESTPPIGTITLSVR